MQKLPYNIIIIFLIFGFLLMLNVYNIFQLTNNINESFAETSKNNDIEDMIDNEEYVTIVSEVDSEIDNIVTNDVDNEIDNIVINDVDNEIDNIVTNEVNSEIDDIVTNEVDSEIDDIVTTEVDSKVNSENIGEENIVLSKNEIVSINSIIKKNSDKKRQLTYIKTTLNNKTYYVSYIDSKMCDKYVPGEDCYTNSIYLREAETNLNLGDKSKFEIHKVIDSEIDEYTIRKPNSRNIRLGHILNWKSVVIAPSQPLCFDRKQMNSIDMKNEFRLLPAKSLQGFDIPGKYKIIFYKDKSMPGIKRDEYSVGTCLLKTYPDICKYNSIDHRRLCTFKNNPGASILFEFELAEHSPDIETFSGKINQDNRYVVINAFGKIDYLD
jgi:hypothetical protein